MDSSLLPLNYVAYVYVDAVLLLSIYNAYVTVLFYVSRNPYLHN